MCQGQSVKAFKKNDAVFPGRERKKGERRGEFLLLGLGITYGTKWKNVFGRAQVQKKQRTRATSLITFEVKFERGGDQKDQHDGRGSLR